MTAETLDNVRTVVLAGYVLRGVDTRDMAAYRKARAAVFPHIESLGEGRFAIEGFEHPVTGEVLDRAYKVLTAAEAKAQGAHGVWTTVQSTKFFAGPLRFCIMEVR